MMITMSEPALVLKNFWPQENRVALLAHRIGRIDGWITQELSCVKLRPGALIEGIFNDRNKSNYYIAEVDLVSLPQLGAASLNFLHSVLELAYYSLPWGLENSEFFQICCYLFHDFSVAHTNWNQQLILCKMLFVLGFYPDNFESEFSNLRRLLFLPIDMILNQKIDLGDQDNVLRWLEVSFWNHPHVNLFRTMSFKIES